jgi:hypothetical protein
MERLKDKYYFASDGSYGLLDEGSVIAYTDNWTLAEWQEIENASDSERAFIARGIFSKYQRESVEQLRRLGGYFDFSHEEIEAERNASS